MTNYRITFVHAPLHQCDQYDSAVFSPMWAYTLASHVPETWEVVIADCLVENPTAIDSATVFAFSGTNQDIDSVRAVYAVLKAKYPNATFILGGPVTWSLEQEGKLDLVAYFDRLFVLDGEETLPLFLRSIEHGTVERLPKVIRGERFTLDRALPIRFDWYRRNADKYYGATIEVSRGCPFLCEFCDVRVLPDNNRANNKSVDLIVYELDEYVKSGITSFLFVCDNFIGDVAWARECALALLRWQKRTGIRLSIFTWVTVNIAKLPELMTLMRRAGFTVLYIGIESVNEDALLETAKVQNRVALKPAILKIQSFGFVIAPGFIFGFDSDVGGVFESTLKFIVETGLLGGDPSFLMAMPGTPLFDRMRRTGRLVEKQAQATPRRKIATNIRYLLDAQWLASGFVRFVEDLTSASTQWSRFRRHVELRRDSEEFVATEGAPIGRADAAVRFLWLAVSGPGRKTAWRRMTYLLNEPRRAGAVLAGWWLTKKAARHGRDLSLHFYFWVYAWTSVGLRYRDLRDEDLSLHSVAADFDVASLAEADDLRADVRVDRLSGARAKDALQARYTRQALARLAARGNRDREGKSIE